MKYAACCDSLYVFEYERDLKTYFGNRYLSTSGPLKNRYAAVVMNFDRNSKFSSDSFTEECREIVIKDNKYTNMYISLNISEAWSVQETIDYYEKIIHPILEVSNEYNVHFVNSSPFQDFGSDEEAAYGAMYSFSNYYKEVLDKFNLEINNISTEEIKPGKYLITINDEYEITVYSDEKLASVIDNVESLKSVLKEKESEMSYE